MNRIRPVMDELIGIEDSDSLMSEVLGILQDTAVIPDIGKIYTFEYRPKTSNLRYDANPVVAVTDLFRWGFRGINFHWGQVRQYTFPEVVGGLYKVDEMELRDLRTIPFGRIRLNS
mgnify:CR=1 FL=1